MSIILFHVQAFIQALLPTAVFSQRFSFFTLHDVPTLYCWKIHFQHSNYRSIARTLMINMIFFCEYYGLVINLHKIDHTCPYSAEYQRNGNYLCIVNKRGWNNYKRLYRISKIGLKIMLVCYHLTISKMTNRVSWSCFRLTPISF